MLTTGSAQEERGLRKNARFGNWLYEKRLIGNQEIERMMSDTQTLRWMWDVLVEINILYFAIKATPYSWVGLK